MLAQSAMIKCSRQIPIRLWRHRVSKNEETEHKGIKGKKAIKINLLEKSLLHPMDERMNPRSKASHPNYLVQIMLNAIRAKESMKGSLKCMSCRKTLRYEALTVSTSRSFVALIPKKKKSFKRNKKKPPHQSSLLLLGIQAHNYLITTPRTFGSFLQLLSLILRRFPLRRLRIGA